ncbi:MDR family MFS transporter [Priestia abyssalis]|uniref:MDR family MFS transporter n=1 Tax=Priestia abyssalis TaxID=1221450 RepID=UPI0009955D1C|nr:MFS transporter [Priestia abyssalis]
MPRSLWLLVMGMLINVTGASFLWPLNTIYIHDHLGKSLSMAGIVLMLNAGASVIGNLLGGVLFDKIGGYKSILLGILITLSALITLVFFQEWPLYIFLLVVIGLGSGIVFPAMYAMGGTVWPEGGRKAFNALYVAQNAGVALGSALGGLVASYSFSYIFIANAVMYVVFFLIAVFSYHKMSAEKAKQVSVLDEMSLVQNKAKFQALLTLCGGYLLCWVAYSQWASTISVYTQELHISLKQYSFLWTINGLIIVLGQPMINAFIKVAAKTLKVQILLGITIFIASFAIISVAQQFSHFLAAMIVLTIGEMFVWPAVPTIASVLAPKGREGFYQGVVNSTATGGRMIGPLIGGILADYYNMNILFYVLIGFLVISMFTTIAYNRKLNKAKHLDMAAGAVS